jgi:metal-responsive CopG/Arc/MetJ family transcriptional regulator
VSSQFVSLRMPEDLLEDARLRAEAEDRSLSAVVRQAVRQYVAGDQDREQADGRAVA